MKLFLRNSTLAAVKAASSFASSANQAWAVIESRLRHL